ncbi:hypothetical protein E2C05_14220 [Paracraurococcus ruber]|nr:hypothetical protein [Paracraurococcus ruber]TDG30481.1 hypothetical protein E2C05_14220 [Paracraurococcus ruber]
MPTTESGGTMPLRCVPRFAPILTLAGLLAGCAQPDGDKFGASDGRAADASAAAVHAFARICGRPEEAEVLRRAAAYGFGSLPPDRVAALSTDAMRAEGVRVLVRPGPGAASVLFWSPARQHCELAVGGVEPAAVAAEFEVLVTRLGSQPGAAVTNISLDSDPGGPMRLRRAVVLAPTALVPTPPRTLSLRVNDTPGQGFPVAMATQAMLPQGAAAAPVIPPPGPGLPKR